MQVVRLVLLFTVAVSAAPHGDAGPLVERDSGKRNGLLNIGILGTCPSVWKTVASDLRSQFGSCNSLARQAIRLPFHDCFPGACDGSIILANECFTDSGNQQMHDICSTLGPMAKKYNVGVADLIQLGTVVALTTCPGGPTLPFSIGRTDSSTANTGTMPSQNDDASSLVKQFAAKGFSPNDLVALVGAHSTATNLQGQGLDTTDTTWDSKFYSETAAGTAPASLNSDRSLSNSTGTSVTWQNFANNFNAWNSAFVSAMGHLTTLGNDVLSLTDCSSVVNGS